MDDFSNAAFIEVAADVRYWEDATVNGVEDTDGTLIPGRDGDTWRCRIELLDGIIVDWPADTAARIHYKVCDAGEYWLLGTSGNRLAKYRSDYVPGEFLCHGSEGFGDYIIMNVEPGGGIVGYTAPKIDPSRWEPVA